MWRIIASQSSQQTKPRQLSLFNIPNWDSLFTSIYTEYRDCQLCGIINNETQTVFLPIRNLGKKLSRHWIHFHQRKNNLINPKLSLTKSLYKSIHSPTNILNWTLPIVTNQALTGARVILLAIGDELVAPVIDQRVTGVALGAEGALVEFAVGVDS